jgi:NADH:ubiquinone oxidoreductase subunit 5 (subunit L)/multisubunit Na+/H+ antiporter MnhA subunit
LGCSAALCTAFYSCRLAFLVFLNKPNSFKKYAEHAHEPSLYMLIPLFLLAFGSIFAGFFFKEFFLGLGTPSFGNSIFVAFDATILDAEFLSPFIKNIPFFFTITGYSLSFLFIFCFPLSKLVMLFDYKKSSFVRTVYTFLSKK